MIGTFMSWPVPRIGDLPYISYLDAGGVAAEAARLRGLDMLYPRGPVVEADRRLLLRMLESEGGRGVIGFFH